MQTIRTFDEVDYANSKWSVGWVEYGTALIFNQSKHKLVAVECLTKLKDRDDMRRSFIDPYPEE
ncbi:MAG: hypothetical protein PHY87_10020 [Sphaerochaeta sp.]|nr:hypothetical protein [Sphaerochaeta sp.]